MKGLVARVQNQDAGCIEIEQRSGLRSVGLGPVAFWEFWFGGCDLRMVLAPV